MSYKMDVLEKIGYGAYGNIYSVVYKGKLYALKQNIKRTGLVGTSILRELSLLKFFDNHPNIVKLEKIFASKPSSKLEEIKGEHDAEDDIYFLFELAHIDLTTYIYNYNSPVNLILKIIADISLAMEYLHICGFIHRDLKPSNILLQLPQAHLPSKVASSRAIQQKQMLNDIDPMKVKAKICDFGFVRRYTRSSRPSTPGVVTIWYRPPEVITQKAQDEKVDSWAIGLLFFEMLFKKALYSITSESDEFELIATIMRKRPSFDDDDRKYMNVKDGFIQFGKNKGIDYTDIYQIDANRKRMIECVVGNLDDIEDLLHKTLEIDPANRISVTEILDHQLFDPLRSYIDGVRNSVGLKVPRTLIKVKQHEKKGLAIAYLDVLYDKLIKTHKVKEDVIFSALDIYYKYTNIVDIDNVTDDILFIIVVTCFYMAYKINYVFIGEYGTNFIFNCFNMSSTFVSDKNVTIIEKDILEKFSFEIYSDTVYTLSLDKDFINVDDLYNVMKNITTDVVMDPLDVSDAFILSNI